MPNLTELASWADIVAVIVAVIAIGVSVWLYFRGRERRALTCLFDSVVSPIEITAGDALGGDIEIRYRGQPVENLFIVRAMISNTGNVPIRQSEVVEPLTFDFGPRAELVRRPNTILTRPSNLGANWFLPGDQELDGVYPSGQRMHHNQATLIFELLNPKDELTTEFVCTGEAKTPKVTARIEGVTTVESGESREEEIAVARLFALTALLLVTIQVLQLFGFPSRQWIEYLMTGASMAPAVAAIARAYKWLWRTR